LISFDLIEEALNHPGHCHPGFVRIAKAQAQQEVEARETHSLSIEGLLGPVHFEVHCPSGSQDYF